MSNRSSILAIGVAALMLLCATAGAIILINNDSNDDSSDSPNRTIRSYSSYANSIEYLPDYSEGLDALLKVRYRSDSQMNTDNEDVLFRTAAIPSYEVSKDNPLLLDALRGEAFIADGDVIFIMDIADLEAYLASIGYIVTGDGYLVVGKTLAFSVPDNFEMVQADGSVDNVELTNSIKGYRVMSTTQIQHEYGLIATMTVNEFLYYAPWAMADSNMPLLDVVVSAE